MSKLLHIKGSRVKVLSSLPTNSFGNDGDIVLSSIKGKGAYLCAKMNGRWHITNKLEDLRKMERTSIRDLKVDKLRVGNATLTKDEYDKPVGDFTLDVAGDIVLNADGGQVTIKDDTRSHFLFDCDQTTFTIYDDTDAADYFRIAVSASGATTIATVDDGAAVGHLLLRPDGNLVLEPTSGKILINAIDGLYFDGDNLSPHTYIYEAANDVMRVNVGGDTMMQLSEKGDGGNEVSFGSSCAGFTQIEPTYDATTTIVDFRHSNKQFLTFGSGDITNVVLTFPLVSGNFVLLVKQDGTGSRTITNWKAAEFDESAADGEPAVKWAGGSAPTLTTDANHVDILSFYWDADNEIAYGVATLDFQF